MTRISTKELNLAGNLGKIRRRPTQSTGPANALQFHELRYDGGSKLTFLSTDFRISLISQLRVEGGGDPWECRVPIANFEAFALTADGGSLTLNPSSPRCVRAEYWSKRTDFRPSNLPPVEGIVNGEKPDVLFAYPFFRHLDTTPFPCDEITEETEPVILSQRTLRKAMYFVASQSEKELTTRLNNCTITTSGDIIAYAGNVFFHSKINPIPFVLNLLCPDAGRLGAWLALFDELPTTEIGLTSGKNSHGKLCYQFHTPDRDHIFRVIAVEKPVPFEVVQQAEDEPAAISGIISRKRLYGLASLFRIFQGSPLECRFVREPNGWQLHLATTGDNPQGGGVLPLDDCQSPDEGVTQARLLVSPVHLRIALDRHRPERLHLSYRPMARKLILTDTVQFPCRPAPAGYQSLVSVAMARHNPEPE